MKLQSPASTLLHIVAALGMSSALLAQSPAEPSVAPSKPQPIPGTYHVLQEHQVQREGRTITYLRVTPPQLSNVPAPAAPEPSAEELALAQSRQGKGHATLSVGATVFLDDAGPVTEIHWTTPGTGRQHKVYSNVDFRLVAGLGTFDSADTVYGLILGIGTSTRAQQPESAVPPLSDFPSDLSVYFISATDTFTSDDEAILTGLDALHAYYDANRARLQQVYAEREAKRVAADQWRKDHPVVPKDEVRFIYKKRATPTSNQGGAQP